MDPVVFEHWSGETWESEEVRHSKDALDKGAGEHGEYLGHRGLVPPWNKGKKPCND